VALTDPPPDLEVQRPPEAGTFFDARRGVYYTKPLLRGWLHLFWFAASLVLGIILLVRTRGHTRITAGAIYATSVSALFGASALYHRGNWTSAWRQRLQRLDHMMIFFLIAGTATPAFLLAWPGPVGLTCLIVVWALAIAAAVVHMAWMNAPELIVGGTFIGLGWVAGLGLPGVWIHAGAIPGCWCWPAGCCTPRGRSATAAAGPTPIRRCSGTTRSFTLTCARRPGASTPLWPC